jgi:hypothetical protein
VSDCTVTTALQRGSDRVLRASLQSQTSSTTRRAMYTVTAVQPINAYSKPGCLARTLSPECALRPGSARGPGTRAGRRTLVRRRQRAHAQLHCSAHLATPHGAVLLHQLGAGLVHQLRHAHARHPVFIRGRRRAHSWETAGESHVSERCRAGKPGLNRFLRPVSASYRARRGQVSIRQRARRRQQRRRRRHAFVPLGPTVGAGIAAVLLRVPMRLPRPPPPPSQVSAVGAALT